MIQRFVIFLALVLAAAPASSGAGGSIAYAAPYGNGGACTADQPCQLTTALAAAADVWLLPGTYRGDVTISAPGITVRSVPGTRARIDGGLTIAGAGVTVQGIEIADSSWTDRAHPSPVQAARYVNIMARDVTILDCWIHDLAGGIYAFNGAGGATAGLTVKDSLIFNIGYGSALGRGTGHAIYSQNDATGVKTFEENGIANQYGFGIHVYGSAGASAQLERYRIVGNVQVNNRMLLGGGRPLRDVQLTDNRLWNSQMQLGYSNQANEAVSIVGNWIGNARLQVQAVLTPTVRMNRIAPGADVAATLVLPQGVGVWDQNSYWKAAGTGSAFDVDGVGFKTFPQWRAYTGWDATSVFTATLPQANWIDVRPTLAHHGIVSVYNWTAAPTVTVDLAPLALTPGATYRLINAQNPAESMPFAAGPPVAVPMTGWTVAAPYGASAPLASFDPRFAVFEVAP